ncbi:hypothetical protein LCGC14_2802060 [marine sediment metagenome]|uniref:DUF4326 domain-containing protein n=1 Tax=marine sediment metagenome TaxID=412755 RepID=A0A0F8YME4_9ZZZZ
MADRPIRVQRKRTKGWRMPSNTVCVTRPSRWGNPWPVDALRRALVHAYDWSGNTHDGLYRAFFAVPRAVEIANDPYWTAEAPAIAVRLFQVLAARFKGTAPEAYEAWLAPLRGKNLCCWCHLCAAHAGGKPLGERCDDCEPCHVDALLELANG